MSKLTVNLHHSDLLKSQDNSQAVSKV